MAPFGIAARALVSGLRTGGVALIPGRSIALAAGTLGRVFPSTTRVSGPLLSKIVTSRVAGPTFKNFIETSIKAKNPKLYGEVMQIVSKHGGEFSGAAVKEILSNPKIVQQLSYQQKIWFAAEAGGIASIATAFTDDDTFLLRTANIFTIIVSDTYVNEREAGLTPLSVISKYMTNKLVDGGKEPVTLDELGFAVNYLLEIDKDTLVSSVKKINPAASEKDILEAYNQFARIVEHDTELQDVMKQVRDSGATPSNAPGAISNAVDSLSEFLGFKKPVESTSGDKSMSQDNVLKSEVSKTSTGDSNLKAIDLTKLPYDEVVTVRENFNALCSILGFSKANTIKFLKVFKDVNKFSPEQYSKLFGFDK